MSGICPGIADDAFLESVLRFVDCEAQMIGVNGYQALAAPGSPLSTVITGLLTLFIAFFGYRLLLGQQPDLRTGVSASLKAGIVLALATSWAAYHTLVYDVAFHGPAELVSNVGSAAGVPGANGELMIRLERVDDALVRLDQLGSGPVNITTRVRNVEGQAVASIEPASEPPTIFGTFALGTARLAFLTATIASYASVRLTAGLLLALGPVFIALLLFDGTRSLFEGWVRALAATMIGAVAVTLLLGAELALLEPWLATLIARRQAELPIGGAATELLVVALAFAGILLAGLSMAARVTFGFRLPVWWQQVPQRALTMLRQTSDYRGNDERLRPVPAEPLSRAAMVAEAVANLQRRDSMFAPDAPPSPRSASPTRQGSTQMVVSPPLGQSHRRRVQNRISGSAAKRDNNR